MGNYRRSAVSKNFPGPAELGRSVVIGHGETAPPAWAGAERVTVDASIYEEPERLVELQRRYVKRIPTVFELATPVEDLTGPAATDRDPIELGRDFTFVSERLTKALWHNSYDATAGGDLIWWWARKAEAWLEVTEQGPADIVLPDGSAIWIDGGPRQPMSLDLGVVHHETIELGFTNLVPPPCAPSSDLALDQVAAVSHMAGPARVIAPAGSGKTRVLTERLRHLVEDRGVEPEVITAVAYNRRAAEEMKERLPPALGKRIRTIHSLGWAILRMAQPHLRLIDEREQRRLMEPIAAAPPRANTDVIGPYLEAMSEVRIGLRSPEPVEASRDDVPGFEDTFTRYQAALADRGEADHDQQIYGAVKVLLSNPELRRHWQGECRHLLVDEFQDLTPSYLLLLRLVSSPGLDVFGVGDDDQVIYGYAGADPAFMIDYESLFPGATGYALEVNYRCPADVVQAASKVLSYNDRRLDKKISAHTSNVGLEVDQLPGVELGMAAFHRIRDLVDGGTHPGRIAVLTRVNSSLLPVQVALAENSIPFQSLLGPSVLDRTLLRGALAWIRIALDTDAMSRNDLFQAVRRPGRGLTRLLTSSLDRRRGPFGLEAIESLGEDLDSKRAKRWQSFCDDIKLAEGATSDTIGLLETLAEDVGLNRAAAALDAGRSQADRSGQGDDLVALQRIASLHDDPATFEPWLRERLATPSDPGGVVLSTVHRVKGLEWDHVIVFGADETLMPHHLSDDIEEERRIFHVAMTRGIESVSILADRDAPSPFISELDGSRPRTEAKSEKKSEKAPAVLSGVSVEIGDHIRVPGGYTGTVTAIVDDGYLLTLDGGGAELTVRWGDRIESATRMGPLMRNPADVDGPLLDRLKLWRTEQATAQGVPAYVIFHDTTLNELSAVRPKTNEELLGIGGIGPAKLEAYGEELLDLLQSGD